MLASKNQQQQQQHQKLWYFPSKLCNLTDSMWVTLNAQILFKESAKVHGSAGSFWKVNWVTNWSSRIFSVDPLLTQLSHIAHYALSIFNCRFFTNQDSKLWEWANYFTWVSVVIMQMNYFVSCLSFCALCRFSQICKSTVFLQNLCKLECHKDNKQLPLIYIENVFSVPRPSKPTKSYQ